MRNRLTRFGIWLFERGSVPDRLVRAAMRYVIAARSRSLVRQDGREVESVVSSLGAGPVTEVPELANEQHYEVPAALFELMLGPQMKYSSCLWYVPQATLGSAEEAMLALTAERAGLSNGQHVLELGCGWGSLTLWMAEHFPDSEITAVTNSASQAAFIRNRASERGLVGVDVVVADIAEFATEQQFDRVVAVEMLEHVRNYRELFERIADWLKPGGRCLVHVFAHESTPYLYEDRGPADWMARQFFSGGVMPSHDLFDHFDDHLRVDHSWRMSGLHYRRTLDAWLERLDQHRPEAEKVLAEAGEPHPTVAVQRWRMFLMACSELFGFRGGNMWGVSHHLLRHSAVDQGADGS
jgi:cyclopropane-fatty-acyl-phospholipid synthase